VLAQGRETSVNGSDSPHVADPNEASKNAIDGRRRPCCRDKRIYRPRPKEIIAVQEQHPWRLDQFKPNIAGTRLPKVGGEVDDRNSIGIRLGECHRHLAGAKRACVDHDHAAIDPIAGQR
jgi:hypothetical protein